MRPDPNIPTGEPSGDTPNQDPTEGRPDLNLPGADRPEPAPDRNDDLPERLGERIQDGPGAGGVATGEPDLLPNVEVPEAQM